MLGFGKKNVRKHDNGYKDFQTEKEYKTPLFYTIMEQSRRKEKMLMVLADKRQADPGELRQLVSAAVLKGYQVYAPKEFDGLLGNQVHYVQTEQRDGIEAILTAGILYTDGSLPFQYVKQQGQIVVFHSAHLDENHISDRIKKSMVEKDADLLLGKTSDGQEIDMPDFIQMLQKGKIKKELSNYSKGRKQKKRILVLLNMSNFETMYVNFHKMTGYFDLDQYEVSICFLYKYLNQYEDILGQLDPRIRIICRQGGLFCDKETARRMDYLDTLGEEEAKREAKYLIEKSVFAKEARRMFGDKKYDYIFNMKFDTLYWKLLMQELEGARIYLEPSSLENLTEEKKSEKRKIYEFYDSIICFNEGQLRQCRELVPDSGKCRLMPYMEHKVPLLKEGCQKRIFGDGKSYIVASVKKDVDFDRFTMQRIPVKEPPAKYCVLDSGMDKETAASFLKEQTAEVQKLYVFDFYKLLKQEDLEQLPNGGKLCLFHEEEIYEGIAPYLGEEIPVQRACECKEGEDLMSYFLKTTGQ